MRIETKRWPKRIMDYMLEKWRREGRPGKARIEDIQHVGKTARELEERNWNDRES